jgi:enoyl-CoA hydratase/carnithine racemase
MSDELLFEIADGVATITLNRPEKLNAFHNGMLADWATALTDCQANDDVAVVVLTGAGRAFCAGGDVKTLGVYEGNAALEIGDYLRTNVHPIARAVSALQKPYLCAVNGPATGAGMDMALMADIRWAGERARFAESYIKLGLVPGDGGAWLLPRLVGMSKALELLWTGDMIDADEAERIGIVSKVCADDSLVEEMMVFAARLAAGPTVGIRLMKQVVRQSQHTDLLGALDLVTGPMGVASNTADHAEACAAFLEKRPAVFRGE